MVSSKRQDSILNTNMGRTDWCLWDVMTKGCLIVYTYK